MRRRRKREEKGAEDMARPPRQSFDAGRLVLKLETGEVLEILFADCDGDTYLLSDGSCVAAHEIEDPLRAGRQRDMQRRIHEDPLEEWDWTVAWAFAALVAATIAAMVATGLN